MHLKQEYAEKPTRISLFFNTAVVKFFFVRL